MNTLRTLKKLLLGETWMLPLGVALTLVGGAVLRAHAGDAWRHAGGFVLLAGVLGVLAASVEISARR